MIAGLIGRWFRWMAAVRRGPGSEELARVGDELARLEARRRQRRRTSS